jgi:hypothetical protein
VCFIYTVNKKIILHCVSLFSDGHSSFFATCMVSAIVLQVTALLFNNQGPTNTAQIGIVFYVSLNIVCTWLMVMLYAYVLSMLSKPH